MAPPPVTPSPHRFVIKKPKRPAQARQPHPGPRAPQFNATPRFHVAPSQQAGVSDGLCREQTPLAHHYSTPAQSKDVIEEHSSEADFDIYKSVEPIFVHERLSADDDDDDYGFRRRSSKRRKVSPSPILDSQDQDQMELQDGNTDVNPPNNHKGFENFVSCANSAVSSPPAELVHRPPGSTAAPRFILPLTPAPVRPSTPATIQKATFVKPPRFRPPDDQEQQQRLNEPLPDAFSPRRRGQKFLAGGLAAEVIGWVMNLESSAPAPLSSRAKEHILVTELLVDEVRGGPSAGMTFISGRQVQASLNGQIVVTSGEVRVVLAGSGTVDGFQKATKVDVRSKVRIKSPVWEVVIEGESWGVAVTWEVLN